MLMPPCAEHRVDARQHARACSGGCAAAGDLPDAPAAPPRESSPPTACEPLSLNSAPASRRLRSRCSPALRACCRRCAASAARCRSRAAARRTVRRSMSAPPETRRSRRRADASACNAAASASMSTTLPRDALISTAGLLHQRDLRARRSCCAWPALPARAASRRRWSRSNSSSESSWPRVAEVQPS